MKKLRLKDLSKGELISNEKLAKIVGGETAPGDTTSVGTSTSITGPATAAAAIETERILESESDPPPTA